MLDIKSIGKYISARKIGKREKLKLLIPIKYEHVSQLSKLFDQCQITQYKCKAGKHKIIYAAKKTQIEHHTHSIYNRIPIHGASINIYTSNKTSKLHKHTYVCCQKTWSKTIDQWNVSIVIEKKFNITNPNPNKYITCNKIIRWDNADSIYLQFELKAYLEKIQKLDLKKLQIIVKEYMDRRTGGNNDSMEIIKDNLRVCDSNAFAPKVNNLFQNQIILNKNLYFKSIINHMSQYYISIRPLGDLHILFINGQNNTIHDLNRRNYIKNTSTNLSMKFSAVLVIKNGDTAIIKYAIIDEGKCCRFTSNNTINATNKKFGKLLNFKYMTYESLSNATYKTTIKKFKGKLDRHNFIEFFHKNTDPINPVDAYMWNDKKVPIRFYCKNCPNEFLKHLNLKQSVVKNDNAYLLFLTGSKYILDNSITYVNENTRSIYQTLFGDTLKENDLYPVLFSPSTYPNAFIFVSNIPDLDSKYVKLTAKNAKSATKSAAKNELDWVFIEETQSNDIPPYGDDYQYAELNIWNNYRNPMEFGDLILEKKEISDKMYFVESKNSIHVAPIKMNNFVKNRLVSAAHNTKNIIDLASGRGSDLWTYNNTEVEKLLLLEIDNDAIDELTHRKYKLKDNSFTKNRSMAVGIINADLTQSYKSLLYTINTKFNLYANKVNFIFCFFALHYITSNKSHIKNIASLISALLNKNGTFIYTAFDSTAVTELLKKHSGKWTVYERGIKKYEIIQQYKDGDIHKEIKLILPFNTPDFYYRETLINDKVLDSEFAKCGLTVKQDKSFNEWMGEFKKRKHKFYSALTPDDKIFIELYKYKIYQKS